MKRAAIAAGALGASLSGSGPSIFALCRNLASADSVAKKMAEAFAHATSGVKWDLHTSEVSARGARLIPEKEAACAT